LSFGEHWRKIEFAFMAQFKAFMVRYLKRPNSKFPGCLSGESPKNSETEFYPRVFGAGKAWEFPNIK